MSKWVKWAAVAALLVVGAAGPARADFINGGFETGNFTGWRTTGNTAVLGTFGTGANVVPPPQGSFQAGMSNGPQFSGTGPVDAAPLAAFVGLSIAQLNALNQ